MLLRCVMPAQLNEEARPEFHPSESHDIYGHLLQAGITHDRCRLQLPSGTCQYARPVRSKRCGQSLSSQVTSFRDWTAANEARNKLRWAWHDYFSEFDALVMPIMATAAFKHDHRPFGERSIMVDNAGDLTLSRYFGLD